MSTVPSTSVEQKHTLHWDLFQNTHIWSHFPNTKIHLKACSCMKCTEPLDFNRRVTKENKILHSNSSLSKHLDSKLLYLNIPRNTVFNTRNSTVTHCCCNKTAHWQITAIVCGWKQETRAVFPLGSGWMWARRQAETCAD